MEEEIRQIVNQVLAAVGEETEDGKWRVSSEGWQELMTIYDGTEVGEIIEEMKNEGHIIVEETANIPDEETIIKYYTPLLNDPSIWEILRRLKDM